MKKLILFLALLFLPFSVWAMPATYGVDITEVDGSPAIGAYKIVFPNGTLTCAAGICTYAAAVPTFADFYLVGPDVTHGMTSIAPTADYLAAFQIGSAGGADIYGMTEADQSGALRLTGIIGATDPTDIYPALILRGGKKNGTGWQALGAAETAFAFYNYTTDIGRVYGNGEWILPALENTPIGQSIARAGNFTSVAIGATGHGFDALGNLSALSVSTTPIAPADYADHAYTGDTEIGTAGATITRGQVLYLKKNGGAMKWYPYDGDDATIKTFDPGGVAVADIASAATGTILTSGTMRDDSWSVTATNDTADLTIYPSGTAGGLAKTKLEASGDVITVIGRIVADNVVHFNFGVNRVTVP